MKSRQGSDLQPSDAQKSSIVDSYKYLLDDFPPDPTVFSEAEQKLTNAVLGPEDKKDDYYLIRECLLHPKNYYAGIEKQGPPIKIKQIRTIIIEHIFSVLKSTNNSPAHWLPEKIIAALPKADAEEIFAAEKPFFDNGNPWDLAPVEGKIYTSTTRVAEVTKTINDRPVAMKALFIDIQTDFAPVKSVEVTTLDDYIEEDEDPIQYQKEIKDKAQRLARNTAARLALEHLTKRQKVVSSEALRKLIVEPYYFGLLASGEVTLKKFDDMTLTQSNRLIHPAIIKLHAANLLSLNKALQLSEPAHAIITHPDYRAMFEEQVFTLGDIETISIRRSQFLIHPFVVKLIKSGKIPFNAALHLPFHLTPLLTSPLYQEYFLRAETNWKNLEPLSNAHLELLLDENFAKLVLENKIAMVDTIEILRDHVGLLNYRKLLVFDFAEVMGKELASFSPVYAQCYAYRLYLIYQSTPLSLMPNSELDAMQKITDDLSISAGYLNFPLEQLKEYTLYYLVQYMGHDWMQKSNEISKWQDKQCYDTLLDIINNQNQTGFSYQQLFIDLVVKAKELQSSLKTQSFTKNASGYAACNHFSTKRQRLAKEDELQPFLRQLIALDEFNQLAPHNNFAMPRKS